MPEPNVDKRIDQRNEERKISRRGFLRYAGGIAAAGVVAATGYVAYENFYRPYKSLSTIINATTTVSKSTATITSENPVVSEYGTKLSPEVINKLKILGTNGLDDNERKLLDFLRQIEVRKEPLKNSGIDSTNLENNLIDVSVEDGTVSKEGAEAIDYMNTHIDDSPVETNYLNNNLNKDNFDVLTGIVSSKDLDKVNPDLVFEAARMKDFKEHEELTDLVFDLYSKNRNRFDDILKEGIPEKRRQCTALEAIGWIYIDGGKSEVETWLAFSPEALILHGWKFTKVSDGYHSKEWSNVEEVTDRLTYPQITQRYMYDNLTYSYTPYEPEGVKSVEEIFKDKKGACYDHALFGCYSLKKNGYDAKGMRVMFLRYMGMFGAHTVGLFIEPKDEMYHTIDVWSGKDQIYGPFKTMVEAAEASTWGHGRKFSYTDDIDLETEKYKYTWE